jgi:hypothetical protein
MIDSKKARQKVLYQWKVGDVVPSELADGYLFLLNLGQQLDQETIDSEGSSEFKRVGSLRELARILDDFATFIEEEAKKTFLICDDLEEAKILADFEEVNVKIEDVVSRIEAAVDEAAGDIDYVEPRRIEFW